MFNNVYNSSDSVFIKSSINFLIIFSMFSNLSLSNLIRSGSDSDINMR